MQHEPLCIRWIASGVHIKRARTALYTLPLPHPSSSSHDPIARCPADCIRHNGTRVKSAHQRDELELVATTACFIEKCEANFAWATGRSRRAAKRSCRDEQAATLCVLHKLWGKWGGARQHILAFDSGGHVCS